MSNVILRNVTLYFFYFNISSLITEVFHIQFISTEYRNYFETIEKNQQDEDREIIAFMEIGEEFS